ncbi:relA/SpoT domain protein [Mycobacterium xenopi 4042]|uniref:RelA/SpoT domain protein n=1 Tax=Mycobacterium xenopi 4042 TaxID=1299334 RepID=X7ZYZ4_MYCXE|nr:relA/SpoT domain protein [Mycobacterium xenopi 4042]
MLQLMTLIERLDEATPRLRVNRNVAWVELRNRVTAATRRRSWTAPRIPSTP